MRAVIRAGFKRKPKRNGDLQKSSFIAESDDLQICSSSKGVQLKSLRLNFLFVFH